MEDSQLTHDSLSWTCGSAYQDILIGLIKAEEDLGLNGIEKFEGIERLEERIFESCNR